LLDWGEALLASKPAVISEALSEPSPLVSKALISWLARSDVEDCVCWLPSRLARVDEASCEMLGVGAVAVVVVDPAVGSLGICCPAPVAWLCINMASACCAWPAMDVLELPEICIG
jgi:hypothetical protein